MSRNALRNSIFTDFHRFLCVCEFELGLADFRLGSAVVCAMQPPAQTGFAICYAIFFSVFYIILFFFNVIALCARNKSRVLITNIKQLPSFDCKSSLKVRTHREMNRKQLADFTFFRGFYAHNFADFLLQENVYFFRTEVEAEKRLLSAAGE